MDTSEKIKVEIPKASEKEIVYIPKGDLGDFKRGIDNRFEKIDNILLGIVASVVVSVIGVVVAVIGLFIDQIRFNNAAYKEYSNKIEMSEEFKNEQKRLTLQNDKLLQIIDNQQILIEASRLQTKIPSRY